jgi:hypothetical protein
MALTVLAELSTVCCSQREEVTVSNLETSASFRWIKSTASGSGNCVEVATHNGAIHIRDSKHSSQAVLAFSQAQWGKFLAHIRKT